MRWLAAGSVVVALAAGGCTPAERDGGRTPLPTRQTTIDPVKKTLDAAADDVERRRRDIDNAAK